MVKREVINIVSQYKALVSSHFDVDKVILFGSYSRGTQKNDSDIDVAIVVNTISNDFFTYAPLLWKLRLQIDKRIEPVLLINGKDESGFLQEILRTGTVIN
ncbi:MAG TPA: nucleotidyltransferase domain-containing protein [Spirochaetota bacterium]|jgi:predicted nucleotidyltransferase|nr:nucleotidyltransferase domain-containing protein [Spirochaetota bacterium]